MNGIFLLIFSYLSVVEAKPALNLESFFNYTSFRSINLSPNGQDLLIHTKRPAWDTNSFENSLWLYNIYERRNRMITHQLFEAVKPQWSPSGNWIALELSNMSTADGAHHYQRSRSATKRISQAAQNIYLYSTKSDTLIAVPTGSDIPLAITWSANDSSLYFSTLNSNSTSEDDASYWKDVIHYGENRSNGGSTIHRIDIAGEKDTFSSKVDIVTVPFLIGELLFARNQSKLIFTSVSSVVEYGNVFEIYSIDVHNVAPLVRLTTDGSAKLNLQSLSDGKKILYQTYPITSSEDQTNSTQQRLYSIDLTNGQIERWGTDFDGNIDGYTTKSEGGVYILGQLGTNTQIYSQQSPTDKTILHTGLDGVYQLISASENSVAFVFSSAERAEEAYCIDNIDQLKGAVAITSENDQFAQFDLPQVKLYQWSNDDDNRTVEGLLHYPPGKFEAKNLPVLVLIHGGPADASLNYFLGNWYTWAPMAAAEGWLVLEPNYRGSTGYGDSFLNEIRYKPLTRPGKDILFGVDSLVKDGIADASKLAVGGYSYGGFLTNWLITQTTRFNAALSGAGAAEHVSLWGVTDMPVLADFIFGGFPWVTPQKYQSESPIYQLNKVRTPTHIVAGEDDIRVPVGQNMMLARGLRYLQVPVTLLLLPNEGHPMSNNPWHGKIKVREELQWLRTYGFNSTNVSKIES